jgi:hypothetical protein
MMESNDRVPESKPGVLAAWRAGERAEGSRDSLELQGSKLTEAQLLEEGGVSRASSKAGLESLAQDTKEDLADAIDNAKQVPLTCLPACPPVDS